MQHHDSSSGDLLSNPSFNLLTDNLFNLTSDSFVEVLLSILPYQTVSDGICFRQLTYRCLKRGLAPVLNTRAR